MVLTAEESLINGRDENDMSEMQGAKGQCLCGVIKYAVDEIEPQMGHCHCKMCRKFHGAAFSTFGEAKVENFHWLEGLEYLETYTAPNATKRQFCKVCGSSLIFIPSNDDGKVVEFSLGTLDTDINLVPDAHIYIKNCASWYTISDDLPQFSGSREDENK